jgi:DNA repair protein RecO (recombination protein O)
MEIKVNALMLRAVDYRDNDKILTLLTAENGKISAGIKGVKKAGAKLKFAAQPFCFAEYILTQKGDKYTVIQASENESFYELRNDICKFYAASSVCEVAEALSYDGDDCYDLFRFSIDALTQMCSDEGSGESCCDEEILIKFLLKALVKSGYSLGLDNCHECGSPLISADKMRFDMNVGCFTCWDCGDGVGASGVTYNVLRKVAGKSYDQTYITADGHKRALRLLKEYLIHKTDARLSTLSEYIRLM